MNPVDSRLELVPLVKPIAERPVWMERQWVAIDGMGTARNSLSTAAVFSGATSTAGAAIGSIIPGFQLAGGLLITYSAAKYTIPNSYKEFKEIHPEDKEGKWVSGLGFVNQLFYGSFGPALTVAGATAVAGLATTGHVASTLMTASEITAYGVLGGLCLARGAVMAVRSAINLNYLIPFHNNFQEKMNKGKALEFLEKAIGKGDVDLAAFKRRVGDGAAEKVQAFFEGTEEIDTKELVKIVDKGIFKQKCKQWLTMTIALLMMIGGIASLVFTAGLSSLAIAAVISISFALMEAEWVLFDKSNWFNAFVDKLYTPLEDIPNQDPIISQSPAEIESISA